MWRKLTLALVGVLLCLPYLPFTPIGLWPLLPCAWWAVWEIPRMVERRRFAQQARREVEELTNAAR